MAGNSYNTGIILYTAFSIIFIFLFTYILLYQINSELTTIWRDIFNNNSTDNHITRYDVLIKNQNINIPSDIKKIQNLSNNYTVSEQLLYNSIYDNSIKQNKAFALSIIVFVVLGFLVFLSLTKLFRFIEKKKREDNDKNKELIKNYFRGLKKHIDKIESELHNIDKNTNYVNDKVQKRTGYVDEKRIMSAIIEPLKKLEPEIKDLKNKIDKIENFDS